MPSKYLFYIRILESDLSDLLDKLLLHVSKSVALGGEMYLHADLTVMHSFDHLCSIRSQGTVHTRTVFSRLDYFAEAAVIIVTDGDMLFVYGNARTTLLSLLQIDQVRKSHFRRRI